MRKTRDSILARSLATYIRSLGDEVTDPWARVFQKAPLSVKFRVSKVKMDLKLFVVLFAAAAAVVRCQKKVPSCETKRCPDARPTCVEGPLQTVCRTTPRGKEICRDTRNVTCERLPAPRAPTDCNMVACVAGQVCMIDDSSRRPRPQCVSARSVPTSCDEVECEEGMRCVERARSRDGQAIARCITVQRPVVSEDCSQLECGEEMQCELRENNNRPVCVRISNCDDLMCDEGFECRERGRRVTCEQVKPTTPPQPLQTCDDIDCPRGFECVMKGDRRKFVPSCRPIECPVPRRPTFCEELECGEDERCRILRNARGRRAVCSPLRDTGKL